MYVRAYGFSVAAVNTDAGWVEEEEEEEEEEGVLQNQSSHVLSVRLWFCFLRAATLSLFCLSALLGVLTLRIIYDFLPLTELSCAVGLKK